jgi:hypothetical protein
MGRRCMSPVSIGAKWVKAGCNIHRVAWLADGMDDPGAGPGMAPWKCDLPKTTALMAVSAVQAGDVLVRPPSFMLPTPHKLSLARAAMGREQRQCWPTWYRHRKPALHTPDGTADRAGSASGVGAALKRQFLLQQYFHGA